MVINNWLNNKRSAIENPPVKPVVMTETLSLDTVKIEDGGHAAVLDEEATFGDDKFFLRFHSWSDAIPYGDSIDNHETLKSMIGKRVKITIEILP